MARKKKLNLKYNGESDRLRAQYFQNVTGHGLLEKEEAYELLGDDPSFKGLIGCRGWCELSDITTLVALQNRQNKTGKEIKEYLKEFGWL